MATKQKYPAHLYDPLRRKIAEQYIKHELKKLFPSVKQEALWQLIEKDVGQWFAENQLVTPVRVFWNGFHAIARGFRFKNLLPKLTSKNIEWQERTIKLTNLSFGFAFQGYDYLGRYPKVTKVKEQLALPEHAQDKAKLLGWCQTNRQVGAFRDNDPIIVYMVENSLRVLDGNRRLFLAMCEGQAEIKSFVGLPAGRPEIFEHWVPTQFLQDLLSLHSQSKKPSKDLTKAVTQIIAETLKNSTSAKIEWEEICAESFNPLDKIIYGQVAKL